MKKIFLTLALSISLFANAQKNEISKTDEVLSEVVKKALTVAEKTGNFGIEQAPDLLKEFYAWELWHNIVIGIIMLFLSYIIYFVSKKIADDDDDELVLMINLFQIIPMVFLFVSIYDIVFLLVAPKLYLIEYFIK